jgi:hypothetical protein
MLPQANGVFCVGSNAMKQTNPPKAKEKSNASRLCQR